MFLKRQQTLDARIKTIDVPYLQKGRISLRYLGAIDRVQCAKAMLGVGYDPGW